MSPSSPRQRRRLVVTSALPYANGPIHIGHLVEYIQTDIWVRYQRLLGHECHYFCADDAHGTAVMLKARQLNTTPEELIERINREHLRDFTDFNIHFDHWHSTHSSENQQLVEKVWHKLVEKDLIITKTITQLYDPIEKQFLSDRMIIGICPSCQAPDQYGDSCQSCGASYEPDQLIEPRSIFGTVPIAKETEHYFFNLPEMESLIREWLAGAHMQPAVLNKLDEWLSAGLKSWDITRDAPYFGFSIPGHAGKFFYVWVDAPIGYIATSLAWSKANQHDNQEFWSPDSPYELHHFIGKDIAYFHILFWPALLHGADLRLPTRVHCHGFLTFAGQKMSKSRGTLIEARQWLRHYDPEYLRYFFAAKLNGEIEDIDFSLEDFHRRINADLIGKLFNIASRCSALIHQHFDGQMAAQPFDSEWLNQTLSGADKLMVYYEERNTNRLIRALMDKTDRINAYIQTHKPWELVKTDQRQRAQGVLSDSLCAFRAFSIWLSPIMPTHSQRALAQFGEKLADLSWDDAGRHPFGIALKAFERLGERLSAKKMARFIREEIEPAQQPAVESTPSPAHSAKLGDTHPSGESGESGESGKSTEADGDGGLIDIADFSRVDLRVACILEAEEIAGADRLLRIKLDIGQEQRTVLAGIRQWYSCEQLRGRLVAMVRNLKPRKTRFGLSEGMILAASTDDGRPYLISVDEGAKPGMRLR